MKILDFLKPMTRIKVFVHRVTTNGFALNHDKSLQIYFFCVKRLAKNGFLKDVESAVAEIYQTWQMCRFICFCWACLFKATFSHVAAYFILILSLDLLGW